MRIGELAQALSVSTDTLRFYERSGLLPRPERAENGYRAYQPHDLERIRLLLDLRRLDLPLDEAARLAGWCQAGHCAETTAELPQLIAAKRAELRDRIAGLEALDARLGALERHLRLAPLPMAGETTACCGAAAIVAAERITRSPHSTRSARTASQPGQAPGVRPGQRTAPGPPGAGTGRRSTPSSA